MKPMNNASKLLSKTPKNEEKTVPREKLKPIAKAERRQKSGVKKFFGAFIHDDVTNIKSYVVNDVVIPSIKKGISEVVLNALDMLFWGQSGVSTRTRNGSKISYRNYSDRQGGGGIKSKYESPGVRDYDYDDIIFDDRGTALEVLSSLDDVVSRFGTLSVADMYDLVGLRSQPGDIKYGWTNISGASVVKINNGYTIKMPRPMPL